uniref:Rhomboid domain containing 1 n=1 Tax=Leptobrachium leishanense TaxID=445787 RepID=A0A8C5M4W5_9ANUR
MQRRHRGANLGLFLLFAQIFQFGFNNIPPVTLAALGLNIYLFLNPVKPLLAVCISVHEGFNHRDWKRLLFSPFHHADDWHLYFNMVSLLWKGSKLESRLGSTKFAAIIAVFSQLIGVIYVILQLFLAELMDDPSYKMQCAVGFSGVLFALKVLNNHYHPGGSTNVFGFQIPNKYSCWVELVVIHLLSPGTSFIGHLSGILVGLLYTHGPLKHILTSADYFTHLLSLTARCSSSSTWGLPNLEVPAANQFAFLCRGTCTLYDCKFCNDCARWIGVWVSVKIIAIG